MGRLAQACNVVGHCRALGVPLWSCPQFLFLIMGGIIIAAILLSYAAASRYTAPEVAVVIVIALAALLVTIAYVIEQAFEKTVEAHRRERARAAELLALKDQFVYVAAHELRAPATAIKWALEVLHKQHASVFNASPDAFEALVTNSDRLLQLVSDLLQVSRLESGMLKVARESVDLSQIVAASMEGLAGEAEKRGIALENRIAASSCVIADPIRLQEVFDNLIGNAIKFNKVGGRVTVSARPETGRLTVSVADTGPGLTPEDATHLFEKFWRSPSAQRIEGTGLGLFIVRQLVTLMAGSISFTTGQDKGTTFFVALPA